MGFKLESSIRTYLIDRANSYQKRFVSVDKKGDIICGLGQI